MGQEKVSAGTQSQAGYSLLSNQAVIVDDLRTETRFIGPPLLREHGVVSGMSVIIPGRDRPFGVLGAHTVKRRAFSKDDIHFLESVANVLSEAIERKRAEQAVRESEEQVRHTLEFNQAVMANMGEGLYALDTQRSGDVHQSCCGAALRLVECRTAGPQDARRDPLPTSRRHALPRRRMRRLTSLAGWNGLIESRGRIYSKGRDFLPCVYRFLAYQVGWRDRGLVVVFRDVTARKPAEEAIWNVAPLGYVVLLLLLRTRCFPSIDGVALYCLIPRPKQFLAIVLKRSSAERLMILWPSRILRTRRLYRSL